MNNYAEVFKALADKTRLRIMRLLSITDGEVCVCEFVDALKLPQYQVSKHLNILKNAKLVEGERRGTWVYYTPLKKDSAFNRQLFKLLKEQLSGAEFLKDEEKLRERLQLRDHDVCVVGFVNGQKLRCLSATMSKT
jgi:ArsR family transcriptional regulator, arsenate/arsenite/antimonite-responsive transcriptional repressor